MIGEIKGLMVMVIWAFLGGETVKKRQKNSGEMVIKGGGTCPTPSSVQILPFLK